MKEHIFLNDILTKYKIDLHIKDDFINSIIPPIENCSPHISDNVIKFILYMKSSNLLVGYLFLEVTGSCVYIDYRCVNKLFRGSGIGTFLAFIAIYYARTNKIKHVYSIGICSKQHEIDADYKRDTVDSKWCSSQAILIKKFGFFDNFKTGVPEDKLYKDIATCGGMDVPETILNLDDVKQMEQYNTFYNTFITNPTIIFNRLKLTFTGEKRKKTNRIYKKQKATKSKKKQTKANKSKKKAKKQKN
jgi:hypothetical protein